MILSITIITESIWQKLTPIHQISWELINWKHSMRRLSQDLNGSKGRFRDLSVRLRTPRRSCAANLRTLFKMRIKYSCLSSRNTKNLEKQIILSLHSRASMKYRNYNQITKQTQEIVVLVNLTQHIRSIRDRFLIIWSRKTTRICNNLIRYWIIAINNFMIS